MQWSRTPALATCWMFRAAELEERAATMDSEARKMVPWRTPAGREILRGDVFPMLEILGADGAVLVVSVFVEVDVPLAVQKDGAGAFRPLAAGDGRAGLRPWAFEFIGVGEEEILGGRGLGFVFHDHGVAFSGVEDGSVNDHEAGIVEEHGLGEGAEIEGADSVETVVVVARAGTEGLGELAFDGGGPEDDPFLRRLVVVEFGGPGVPDIGFIRHQGDGLLGGPVAEVFGISVADGFALPGCGPDHVESAVWAAHDGGIAHELRFAHFRLEQRFSLIEFGEAEAIVTRGQVEAVFSVVAEEAENELVGAWRELGENDD